MSPLQIAEVALILLASSMIQGMVGFASGMVAIPLLLIVGTTLPEAVAISAVAAFAQNLLGLYAMRREVPFRESIRPIAVRFLALPIGILALKLSGRLESDQVRQIVGAVVLGTLLVVLRSPDRSRQRWPRFWDWTAFLSSGFLVGFCGIGGPPIVMWAMAQGWPPGKTRGFLFLVFFSSMFPQLALLGLAYGKDIGPAMLAGVIGAPIVLAGTYLGLRIGRHFSQRRLRWISFAILTVVALVEVLRPFLKTAGPNAENASVSAHFLESQVFYGRNLCLIGRDTLENGKLPPAQTLGTNPRACDSRTAAAFQGIAPRSS